MKDKLRTHKCSRLILIAVACIVMGGCSTALITFGVLDRTEQDQMFSATDRTGLETFAGTPVASRINPDGTVVDLYNYIDGEAGVVGKSGRRPMHGERAYRTIATLMTAGFFEPFLILAALSERSEATRTFYVVYAPDNSILAICHPAHTVNVSDREKSLCDRESAPVVEKDR